MSSSAPGHHSLRRVEPDSADRARRTYVKEDWYYGYRVQDHENYQCYSLKRVPLVVAPANDTEVSWAVATLSGQYS